MIICFHHNDPDGYFESCPGYLARLIQTVYSLLTDELQRS